MTTEQRKLVWNDRIPVWACAHLWERAASGGQDARETIASAAVDLALDTGENVALCQVCKPWKRVLMTRRWVNTVWLDGGHQVITDVSETQDGPALPGFDVPGVVSGTVVSEG